MQPSISTNLACFYALKTPDNSIKYKWKGSLRYKQFSFLFVENFHEKMQ